MSNFGLASIKQEGMVSFEIDGIPQLLPRDVYIARYGPLPVSDWTYVERRVPVKYENEIHILIDRFLKKKKVKE